MGRIEPLPRSELPHYEAVIELVEAVIGFVPGSLPTMARIPGLLDSFAQLAAVVMNAGAIDPGLAQMVGHVASTAAGCRYCQAHTAEHAAHVGVDPAKVRALWGFDTDDRFSASERAAFRLARDAALVPNAVGDRHFADLARHYTDEQIVQLVATVALFGFLNRWNDTLATTIEPEPLAFATQHLAARGWTAGKHATPATPDEDGGPPADA